MLPIYKKNQTTPVRIKNPLFKRTMYIALIVLNISLLKTWAAPSNSLPNQSEESKSSVTNATATTSVNSPNQQKEKTQENSGTPVVFDTLKAIENMEPGSIVSKTFYYSNANDDPASTPEVGQENGINYIKISALGGNPSKMSETISKIDRWVKVPEGAPKQIIVTFKTKVTKNEGFDSITTPGSKAPERRNSVVIDFLNKSGQTTGKVRIASKKLTTLDTWVDHSYTVDIPTGGEYLHLGLETSGGYSLWLGNWQIK